MVLSAEAAEVPEAEAKEKEEPKGDGAANGRSNGGRRVPSQPALPTMEERHEEGRKDGRARRGINNQRLNPCS